MRYETKREDPRVVLRDVECAGRWDTVLMRRFLASSDNAVRKGMFRLWSFQTQDERFAHATRQNNGVGFGKFDAPKAGALLEKVMRQKEQWTDADMRLGRHIAMKYAGQLAQQANISRQSG